MVSFDAVSYSLSLTPAHTPMHHLSIPLINQPILHLLPSSASSLPPSLLPGQSTSCLNSSYTWPPLLTHECSYSTRTTFVATGSSGVTDDTTSCQGSWRHRVLLGTPAQGPAGAATCAGLVLWWRLPPAASPVSPAGRTATRSVTHGPVFWFQFGLPMHLSDVFSLGIIVTMILISMRLHSLCSVVFSQNNIYICHRYFDLH